MAAVNARGESARDRAVRRVLAELDRLGAGARITLVRSGDRPSVLAGPAAFAVEARPALDSLEAGRAASFARARPSAGAGARRPDRQADGDERRHAGLARRDDEGALWVSVGEPLANVGITAAERTLVADEGRGTVSLTLGNYSDSPARRRVSVSAGDKNVLARELDVPPGISSLTLPLPAGSAGGARRAVRTMRCCATTR